MHDPREEEAIQCAALWRNINKRRRQKTVTERLRTFALIGRGDDVIGMEEQTRFVDIDMLTFDNSNDINSNTNDLRQLKSININNINKVRNNGDISSFMHHQHHVSLESVEESNLRAKG